MYSCKLMKAYLNPFALALGDGLNNSWYYTAETHDRLGFDLSLSVSAIKITGSAKTFDISQISLSDAELDPAYGLIAPTVAGEDVEGPKLNLWNPNSPGDTIGSFRSPPGLGMDVVPVPVAQLGIGLFPHTDILLRYVPKLHFNQEGDSEENVRVGLFGIGAKHSFKDWIPGIKHLPFDHC